MSGEISRSDVSNHRATSIETYSTRSSTVDSDSHSEKRPFINNEKDDAEDSSVFRVNAEADKSHYDDVIFSNGGGNGGDDDSIMSDLDDNDFDALVGEFFWFLRNKENYRTPVKSPGTPSSREVLTPRHGISVKSPSSKGSHRPSVYTKVASTPPISSKASNHPDPYIAIENIATFGVETETVSSTPVSSKTSDHGDEKVFHEIPFLAESVQNEESSSISVNLEEKQNEITLISEGVDNEQTSLKASVSLEGLVDTDESSSVSLKASIHNDENIQLTKESKSSSVIQPIVKKNDPHIKAYEKWVKKGLMSKMPLVEGAQKNSVTLPFIKEDYQQSKAYKIWEKKGMMSPEPTPNKEDMKSRPSTKENEEQFRAYSMWKERGLMSPMTTPGKEDIQKNRSMKENDQQSKAYEMWKEKGLMSPEPTPNKEERKARVASLIARSKMLLGKVGDIALTNKRAESDEFLQDALLMHSIGISVAPSPEPDSTRERSTAIDISPKSVSGREPNDIFSTPAQKSLASSKRKVSFSAQFLDYSAAEEESAVSVSNCASPISSSGWVTVDDMPPNSVSLVEPSVTLDTHPTHSASDLEYRRNLSTSTSQPDPPTESPDSSDRKKPSITIDDVTLDPKSKLEPSSTSITLNDVTLDPTSERKPSSTIDTFPIASTTGAEPSGIIFDATSRGFIFDDVALDPPIANGPSSTISLLVESPSDEESSGSIPYAPSPDSTDVEKISISLDDIALDPTSDAEPSGTIDSLPIESTIGAEPNGIIFYATSPDSANGKETMFIFDDVAPDPKNATAPSGATSLSIESPSDEESRGSIPYASSPDSADGKKISISLDNVALDPTSDPEPSSRIDTATSPDSANGKETRFTFDDVAPDSTSATAPSGDTSLLIESPSDEESSGSIPYAPSPDSEDGKKPRITLDDVTLDLTSKSEASSTIASLPIESTTGAEPNGIIFDATLPDSANRKETRFIFDDVGPDPPNAKERSDTTSLLIESPSDAEPSCGIVYVPSPDSADGQDPRITLDNIALDPTSEPEPSSTIDSLLIESTTGAEPSGSILSVQSPDSADRKEPRIMFDDTMVSPKPSDKIATLLVESGGSAKPNSSLSIPKSDSTIAEKSSDTFGTLLIESASGGEPSISPSVPQSDSSIGQETRDLTATHPLDSPKSADSSYRLSNIPVDSVIKPDRITATLSFTSTDTFETSSITTIPSQDSVNSAKGQSSADVTVLVYTATGTIISRSISTRMVEEPSSVSIPPRVNPDSAEELRSVSNAPPLEALSGRQSSAFDSPQPGGMSGSERSGTLVTIPLKGSPEPEKTNTAPANSNGGDSVFVTLPARPIVKRSNSNFSSILSQWKEKSERNENGHFLSQSKDATPSRTPSKTTPSRTWSPPDTTPNRSLSKDVSSRRWTPSQAKTVELLPAVSTAGHSEMLSQSRSAGVPSAVPSPSSSETPRQSKVVDKPTYQSRLHDKPVTSPVLSKALSQSKTEGIPTLVFSPSPVKASSQSKTEDIPDVCSRAWTPSRRNGDMIKDSKVTNKPCSCSCDLSPWSGNDQLVEFFLPKLGMAHTCGKRDPPILIDSDPIALKHILRPWQVEFLQSVDIYRGDQLVKECNTRAGTLAGAMRKWRLENSLSSPKTISCGMALHIWSKTCKYYVRSIRRQMANGLVEVEPPTLSEVMSSFLDKDNGVSVPVERRMSLLTMGEPDSQREM